MNQEFAGLKKQIPVLKLELTRLRFWAGRSNKQFLTKVPMSFVLDSSQPTVWNNQYSMFQSNYEIVWSLPVRCKIFRWRRKALAFFTIDVSSIIAFPYFFLRCRCAALLSLFRFVYSILSAVFFFPCIFSRFILCAKRSVPATVQSRIHCSTQIPSFDRGSDLLFSVVLQSSMVFSNSHSSPFCSSIVFPIDFFFLWSIPVSRFIALLMFQI